MKKIVFRPEAELEVLEAQLWYEECVPGLGMEFARSVDVTISSIIRNPFAYSQIEGDFRSVLLQRFPYSIIYLPEESEIVIVSCFHHRRKPGSWHYKD